MKFRVLTQVVLVALAAQLVSGCGAMIQAAMVDAGKSATADDTGFLKSYQGLAPTQDPAYPNLPDLSYVSPKARISTYKKVLMPDFTSMTPDTAKLAGLQIRQYKAIKQELPDLIANTFDGSTFSKVSRTSDRIDPKDMTAIRKLPADAVLMGNIKELASMGGENRAGLTSIQIEYKLIDIKTGEEVLTAIHRSTTDLDKIAMGQVRVLSGLLNKAKVLNASASAEPNPKVLPAVATTASSINHDAAKVSKPPKASATVAAKSTAPSIPEKLRGTWEEKQKGCKDSIDSNTHIVVESNMIRMVETGCRLKNITQSDEKSMNGNFSCSDSSGKSSAKFSLKLVSDNEILFDKNKMIRCM